MKTGTREIKLLLKQLIKDSKTVNQKSVAAAVGITDGYLSQLLDGKRAGGVALLSAIAKEVGTSLAELDEMTAGIKEDPFRVRSQVMTMVEKFEDQPRIIRILHKLYEADRLGCLDEIENFCDFILDKNTQAGVTAPAPRKKIA